MVKKVSSVLQRLRGKGFFVHQAILLAIPTLRSYRTRTYLWFNPLMNSSLLPFFQPQGVVVIGASTSPKKLGFGVARNLIQSGYQV
jgi:hypothetical protein